MNPLGEGTLAWFEIRKTSEERFENLQLYA